MIEQVIDWAHVMQHIVKFYVWHFLLSLTLCGMWHSLRTPKFIICLDYSSPALIWIGMLIFKFLVLYMNGFRKHLNVVSGVRRKKFGGFKGMACLVGDPGGGAPRTPENFRKFAKKFLKKIAKRHYFMLFFKKNYALNFCAFGRKTQLVGKILIIFVENSIEKLNFYLFLRKVVAKNRAFGNNIIFIQKFIPVRGGGVEPL